MPCNQECACESQLYHDVKAVLARYDAPIPYPSRDWIIGELRDAIDRADEDADEVRSQRREG